MKKFILSGWLAFCWVFQANAIDPNDTRLIQQPTVSNNQLAFIYDDDVWISQKDGSHPRRLTANPAPESRPHFSKDGKWLAFSGNYDGNFDVYVVPAKGGVPKRLTWHSAPDTVLGWTNDNQVIFTSQREVTTRRHSHAYTIGLEDKFPTRLPLPSAFEASMSADDQNIAYVAVRRAYTQWKNYRGGTHSRVQFVDLDKLDLKQIPQPESRSNDADPMWLGNKIYFLSDRNGEFNLYAFDTTSGKISQKTDFKDFPVLNASANGTSIVFEQAGSIYHFDTGSNELQKIQLKIAADLRQLRTRYLTGEEHVREVSISPDGQRAVANVRGEIVTVPAEKGDPRYLSPSAGSHERHPIWSADGKSIAYFSDKSGEYQLMVQDQAGLKPAKAYNLKGTGFYFTPKWSADGKRISYIDNSQSLYVINLSNGSSRKIASQVEYSPLRSLSHNWSPDSKWLVYTIEKEGLIETVYLYSVNQKKSFQVTDGLTNVSEPVFDKNGDFLYFLGSTDAGPAKDWFAQSNNDMIASSNLFLATLNPNTASPFVKESDEVEGKGDNKTKKENKNSKSKNEDSNKSISLENIADRIIAFPLKPALRKGLSAGKEGEIYYLEANGAQHGPNQEYNFNLQKFSLKDREASTLVKKVDSYQLAHAGSKLIYQQKNGFFISSADKIDAGKGKLNFGAVQIKSEPLAEWLQIFDEAWRINRDYFYATNYHGADWQKMREKYRPFVKHAATRADVGRIIVWMLSELAVGHSFYFGEPKFNEAKNIPIGLLGADFEIRNNRYRFKKVFGGLNWTKNLRAPLRAPGVNVKAGDYLISVNGKPVLADQNVFAHFEHSVGKLTTITVSSSADGKKARSYSVEPIANDRNLRHFDWVEGNLDYVNQKTNGKVAYVYLPNTTGLGHEYFKRYFYPQVHKKAIILDERFNGGGQIADYYIDMLRRPFIANWVTRYGRVLKTPKATIDGPKVMLIDEGAGSGGDLLPWMFRKFNMGTLIGKRTWGGLVGILGFPNLMDGSFVTAPDIAILTEDGWIVENEGVAPDIEVEQTPIAIRQGRDPQLDKAIQVVLEELKRVPTQETKVPAFPVRTHSQK